MAACAGWVMCALLKLTAASAGWVMCALLKLTAACASWVMCAHLRLDSYIFGRRLFMDSNDTDNGTRTPGALITSAEIQEKAFTGIFERTRRQQTSKDVERYICRRSSAATCSMEKKVQSPILINEQLSGQSPLKLFTNNSLQIDNLNVVPVALKDDTFSGDVYVEGYSSLKPARAKVCSSRDICEVNKLSTDAGVFEPLEKSQIKLGHDMQEQVVDKLYSLLRKTTVTVLPLPLTEIGFKIKRKSYESVVSADRIRPWIHVKALDIVSSGQSESSEDSE
ncbi:hypothetical protein ACJJTC_004677 [Scirpophaga incertulas]